MPQALDLVGWWMGLPEWLQLMLMFGCVPAVYATMALILDRPEGIAQAVIGGAAIFLRLGWLLVAIRLLYAMRLQRLPVLLQPTGAYEPVDALEDPAWKDRAEDAVDEAVWKRRRGF